MKRSLFSPLLLVNELAPRRLDVDERPAPPAAVSASIAATRIQIICPCSNDAQLKAVHDVLDVLLRDENVRRWGGFTCSSLAEPSVAGAFWNESRGAWDMDRSVLIFIDATHELERHCREYASELHDEIARIYSRHQQPQRRLWVSVHAVTIVNAGTG